MKIIDLLNINDSQDSGDGDSKVTRNIHLKNWKKYFEDRGLNNDIIDQYLPYIDQLNKNGVPIIFELEHLSSLVGIKIKYLSRMIHSSESFYRTYKMPKKRGGFRTIDAPYPSILSVQKWIYKEILYHHNISEYAHGFIPEKSIITNAKIHAGKKAFLKIDIKDFFHSIKKNQVINIFEGLGYSYNVSYYLGALCCCRGHLAQGAATSPAISNIICKDMDEELNCFSKKKSLKYSRYADDIAISGRYIPHKSITLVSFIIGTYNFQVNREKTYLSTKSGKRILTGISISDKDIKLPRRYKRKLKKELHFVIKFGYLSHAERNNIRDPFYLESLHGKVQFWLSIEPNNKTAIVYEAKLKDIINYIKQ